MMNQETLTSVMISGFAAGFALLLAMLGFFGSRYVRSTDKLADAVEALNDTIATMDKTQAIHGRDIEELKKHICTDPDCPMRVERRSVARG